MWEIEAGLDPLRHCQVLQGAVNLTVRKAVPSEAPLKRLDAYSRY